MSISKNKAPAAIHDAGELLQDLIDCGTWFSSALEIDRYKEDPDGNLWCGEILEQRIRAMIIRLREAVADA